MGVRGLLVKMEGFNFHGRTAVLGGRVGGYKLFVMPNEAQNQATEVGDFGKRTGNV